MLHAPKKLILLGGSAGGIEATSQVLAALPADLGAAVFVVIHSNPSVPSLLPDILARRTKLRVISAQDGATIKSGTVYVAPPDRHLTIHGGHVRLGRGPRENGFRPAVDPLFRSAAAAVGPDVIAVVLSGNLEDGTSGLQIVKKCGGTAIVQDPDDAFYPGMPASALQEVRIDYVLPALAIGERIVALVNEARVPSITLARDSKPDTAIGGDGALAIDDVEKGKPADFGCPDCGGSLREYTDGNVVRYRCRVGHAFSDEALLAAQTESLEAALWTALRALEENHEQAIRISNRMRDRGHAALAERFRKQAEAADRRAAIVRGALQLGADDDEKIQVFKKPYGASGT